MKLAIGSKNQIKIAAVREAIMLYPEQFSDPELVPVKVDIEEFGHPKSLEETVKGAVDRAKAAFVDCEYSFGIEGGLMAVPQTKTGFMEVQVCAIYDGENIHLGLSSGFEWPKKVFDLIMNKGMDGSQAVREAGLTDHEKIGAAGGVISILTQGKTARQTELKHAVLMALIHVLNRDLF